MATPPAPPVPMALSTKAIPPKEMPCTRSKAFPPQPKYAAPPAVVEVENVEVENMEATGTATSVVKEEDADTNMEATGTATCVVKEEDSDTNDDDEQPIFSKWYGLTDVHQATR